MNLIPSRVSSPPVSTVRSVDRIRPSLVSTPFNGILERAPLVEAGRHAHSGFRSRVFSTPQRFSKQVRVPRLYFTPQPFVNCLLQSFPLTKIVTPSRAHWLPCGYRPMAKVRRLRPCYSAFPPTPTPSGAVARLPREAMHDPFNRPEGLHPGSSWTTDGGITSHHQLHPLRSVLPFVNPFASNPSCPEPTVAALLVFSLPFRDS